MSGVFVMAGYVALAVAMLLLLAAAVAGDWSRL